MTNFLARIITNWLHKQNNKHLCYWVNTTVPHELVVINGKYLHQCTDFACRKTKWAKPENVINYMEQS